MRQRKTEYDLVEIYQETRTGLRIPSYCRFTDGEEAAIERAVAPEIAACGGIDVLTENKELSDFIDQN